jgi:hypothetical protein
MLGHRSSARACRLVSLSLCMGLVAGASASAQAPGGDNPYPKEVYFDFRGKPLPPEMMVRPDGAERFVRSEPEGLRVTVPKNRDNLEPVKLSTHFGVQGDFEITATVEILQAEKVPPGAWGVGSVLFLSRVDPTNQGASFGRLSRPDGKEVVYGDLYGKPGETDIDFQPCADKLVRLRLKRTGSQLAYLLGQGPADGENFKEVTSKNFGRDDIHQVTVRVLTGKQPFSVDARLIDLRIRSGGMSANRTSAVAQPAPRSRVWLVGALLIALTIVVSLVLGFVLRKRGRDARKASTPAARVSVSFTCPKCGRILNIKPDMAGMEVKCSQCATAVFIPAVEAGEARGAAL